MKTFLITSLILFSFGLAHATLLLTEIGSSATGGLPPVGCDGAIDLSEGCMFPLAH